MHGGFDRVAPAVISRPLAVVIASVLLVAGGVTVVAVDGPGDALPTLQDRSVMVRLEAAPGHRAGRDATGQPAGSPPSSARFAGVESGRRARRPGDHRRRSGRRELRRGLAAYRRRTPTTPPPEQRWSRGPRISRSGRQRAQTYADDRVAAASRRVGGATAGEELVVRVYGRGLRHAARHAPMTSRTLLSTVPGVLAPRVESQVSEPTVRDLGRPGGGRAARPSAGRRPARDEHVHLRADRRQPVRATEDLRRRRLGWSGHPPERRAA